MPLEEGNLHGKKGKAASIGELGRNNSEECRQERHGSGIAAPARKIEGMGSGLD